MRLFIEQQHALFNRCQHFVGFFEKDAEQLGINFLATGLRQLDRLGRRPECLQSLWLERRQRLIDLRSAIFTRLQRRQHGLGLLAKGHIGDQIGIIAQRRQIGLQFGEQSSVIRLLLVIKTFFFGFTIGVIGCYKEAIILKKVLKVWANPPTQLWWSPPCSSLCWI